jgi:para-nitrobenzyl esterase
MNLVQQLLIGGICALWATISYADVFQETRPIVQIKNGALQGVENHQMVVFKNIPYAAPPTGLLRWRPPQPVSNWVDVRDASQFGEACPQPAVQGLNNELIPGNEDCLKLNVYAPKSAKNLPVMVWFHGGALIEGSAKEPYYEPMGLVPQGVIVVTVDYRIGKLGFFAPSELVEEAKMNREPVGNYGTMDQIQSLKWVKENIDSFGGDPNNVTIFGQSAGGRSVTWLMVSPAAKGLFHKAIAQSAQQLPLREQSTEKFGMASAETIDAKFIQTLGVKTLAELRALPADKLLLTSKNFQAGDFGGAFIDGQIIVGDPIPLFAVGKQHKVPFMIGSNSWDASFFVLNQPPVTSYLQKMSEDLAMIHKLYKDFKYPCVLSAEIMADGWYRGSVKLLADSANKYAPAYAYNYAYVTPNIRTAMIGPAHTFELPYVFGALEKVPHAPPRKMSSEDLCEPIQKAYVDMKERGVWSSYWFPSTDPSNHQDVSISNQLTQSWAAFARTGNPNVNKSTGWPRYEINRDVMREFKETKPGMIKDLHKARVDYQIKAIKSIYGVDEVTH